jgi:predicted ATPase
MAIVFYTKAYRTSLPKDAKFPALALVTDNWNDFGYFTLYNLVIFSTRFEEEEIGHVKILERDSDNTTLPDIFEQLQEQFCSLGQSIEYYENIKKHFPNNFTEILNSLNDVSINDYIAKKFKNVPGFSQSLLRFSSAEKVFMEAKLLLFENRKTVNEDLAFNYSIKLEGANSEHNVFFDFKLHEKLPFRINVIIGKNGTGKTQLLGSLVNSLSGLKDTESITPYNPLFNKIIAISYSLFDNFPKPPETTVFSYKYIGLRVNDEEIISDKALEDKLKKALMQIVDENRSELWFEMIDSILPLQNLGLQNHFSLTKDYINDLSYKDTKRLSSGQSITLFIISELIANIKHESLILFDEPETHLHPSAISQLVNMFYKILHEFNSYAIISTHSPIIIQDLPSKYITIFDRQGSSPIIRKLPIESFGENISSLTSKIFETIDVKELYKTFLENFLNSSEAEIDENFEQGLSINAQLYLTALKNNINR